MSVFVEFGAIWCNHSAASAPPPRLHRPVRSQQQLEACKCPESRLCEFSVELSLCRALLLTLLLSPSQSARRCRRRRPLNSQRVYKRMDSLQGRRVWAKVRPASQESELKRQPPPPPPFFCSNSSSISLNHSQGHCYAAKYV